MAFNRFHKGSSSSRRSGFSLLQTSLLLTMGAVVMVSMLPGQRNGDNNQKLLDDTKKLEQVEEGMKRFMAMNGRRPCPADGQYDVNNNNFGLEAGATSVNTPAATCKGGAPVAPMGPDAGTGYIVGGNIPTKTLGLPDDYAFDSYGRRFTYLVDTRATNATTCYGFKTGGLQIKYKDPAGTVSYTDNVMYAYISHGQDGHGAWPAAGSSVANRINKGSTDADQLTNAGVNAAFTYNTALFTNSRIKKDHSSTFDDLVFYQEDLKNSCCYGTACSSVGGFQSQGEAASDHAGQHTISIDLNGDGVSDLVSCSPDAGSGAGAVYVVFGTKSRYNTAPVALSSLNGTTGTKITGVAAGDHVCSSLAAGDINGDDIQDLIIGAKDVNSGKGATYVVLGSTSAWPASCSLSGLNGTGGAGPCTKGFRIDGVAAGDNFGFAVATGDFDHDGYSDILVGAPAANSNDGAAYLMCGGTTFAATVAISGLAGIPNSTPTCGFRIDPPASAAEHFGHSLSMGNIKDDPYSDIVIGAPYATVGVWWEAGKVYSVCGGTGALSTPVVAASVTGIPAALGSCGTIFDGVDQYHHAGEVVKVGDIKGDGVMGVAIGAPDANPSGNVNAGVVYYVYGKSTFSSSFDLNTVDASTDGFRIDGEAGSHLGKAISTEGDVNGDGIPDLVIGAPNASPSGRSDAGEAHVVFGATSNLSTMSVTALDGTSGFTMQGAVAGDNLGTSVTTADYYNSGRCNVMAAAPNATAAGNAQAGSVYSLRAMPYYNQSYDVGTAMP